MGQIENDEQAVTAINELPGEIYQQTLKDIIKNNFDSPLESLQVKINAASSLGDNYIGVLYRANIRDSEDKELNVIMKLPPPNAARREQFFARPCFLRESEFYDTIFPMYRNFQEEKGLDVENEGFYQVASCYKSLTDEPFEGLYLEDLKVTGFEMFDRFKEVTAEHVYRVMESLGKLHALSFALRDQKPELLEPYKAMQDIFLQGEVDFKNKMKSYFDMLKKQAAETVSDNPNEDLKSRVSEVLEDDFFDMLESCVDGPAIEPYAVICHGDCWNNNIMYRNENGIPVEIRLLDWQIMRYASPVCDLLYYIFGCTTKALRSKHYSDFMDVYYASFSSFLTKLGSNPSELYPREVFDDHLKRFGKFGLAMAIMILPIITSKVEDTPDMDELAEKFKEAADIGTELDTESMSFGKTKGNQEFNDRMRGVLEDMYAFKYI